MTPFPSRLRRALAFVVALTTSSMASFANADGLQEASKLLRQGQAAQALEQIDIYLADQPRDASARFLRGVILTEMNRSSEAIAIFTKLTEDYPDLPEPYNNLAVIYAQQKQYDKAKTALEAAIRTHPSYATAHENLGDIYARLASQAYDKALQLDSSNQAAQTKLSMIRNLMTVSARGNGTVSTPAIPASAGKSVPAAGLVKPAPNTAVTATPVPALDAAPVTGKPVAVKIPAPAAKTEAPPAMSNEDDVAKVLSAWAEAWSRKNAKAYLGFYASDFTPPDGLSRSAWEAERTKRVTKPGSIRVSIERAQITAEGDRVVVKFRQHYRSASLSTSSNKTLLMARQKGQWKIVQERIGG